MLSSVFHGLRLNRIKCRFRIVSIVSYCHVCAMSCDHVLCVIFLCPGHVSGCHVSQTKHVCHMCPRDIIVIFIVMMMRCVICHVPLMSCVCMSLCSYCHVVKASCHVSCVILLCVMCRVSYVMCHMSCRIESVAFVCVMCHMSCRIVLSYVSCVVCHVINCVVCYGDACVIVSCVACHSCRREVSCVICCTLYVIMCHVFGVKVLIKRVCHVSCDNACHCH
jgi:hypothetical protein